MSNNDSDDLDLHEYKMAEAIEKFVQCYNTRVKNNQCGCWKIIHGYGSTGSGGVIRSKLRSFLDQHRNKLRCEFGDQYGNPGWTWVYPKIKLPDRRERLAFEIIEVCIDPKSEEKILREFAAEGGVLVKDILRSLVKQGQLRERRKGLKVQYQAGS